VRDTENAPLNPYYNCDKTWKLQLASWKCPLGCVNRSTSNFLVCGPNMQHATCRKSYLNGNNSYKLLGNGWRHVPCLPTRDAFSQQAADIPSTGRTLWLAASCKFLHNVVHADYDANHLLRSARLVQGFPASFSVVLIVVLVDRYCGWHLTGMHLWRGEHSPLIYLAQMEFCRRLIVVPLTTFHRLAEKIGDPQGELIFLFNTIRCGSTLLTQVWEQPPEQW